MNNTYFEILPKELIDTIFTKLLDYQSICNFIEALDLVEEEYYRISSTNICPYLKKFSLYNKFRGRLISWRNIFEEFLEYKQNKGLENIIFKETDLYNIEAKYTEILILQLYDFYVNFQNKLDIKILKLFSNKLVRQITTMKIVPFPICYKIVLLYSDIIKMLYTEISNYLNNKFDEHGIKIVQDIFLRDKDGYSIQIFRNLDIIYTSHIYDDNNNQLGRDATPEDHIIAERKGYKLLTL